MTRRLAGLAGRTRADARAGDRARIGGDGPASVTRRPSFHQDGCVLHHTCAPKWSFGRAVVQPAAVAGPEDSLHAEHLRPFGDLPVFDAGREYRWPHPRCAARSDQHRGLRLRRPRRARHRSHEAIAAPACPCRCRRAGAHASARRLAKICTAEIDLLDHQAGTRQTPRYAGPPDAPHRSFRVSLRTSSARQFNLHPMPTANANGNRAPCRSRIKIDDEVNIMLTSERERLCSTMSPHEPASALGG